VPCIDETIIKVRKMKFCNAKLLLFLRKNLTKTHGNRTSFSVTPRPKQQLKADRAFLSTPNDLASFGTRWAGMRLHICLRMVYWSIGLLGFCGLDGLL
jgi:hypothetical protein